VAKNEDLVESKTPSLHFLDVVPKIAQFFKTLNLEKYKLHEALYVFDEEALSGISTLLRTCRLPHSYDSYKDVLSEKFTEYLRLSPNDMILFVDGDVYVKRYFQIETAQENVDRRACGITTEMLEGYKKRYFPNKAYRELIFELFPFVIEDILSYKKNTPSHFKKIFIPALVNCVEIIVIGHSELDDLRSIRGLTFYLLRELFDEIMLFIAEDILFHFSNGERKAIEFLSCFSVHETIDAQGKRHKANPILDDPLKIIKPNFNILIFYRWIFFVCIIVGISYRPIKFIINLCYNIFFYQPSSILSLLVLSIMEKMYYNL